MARSVDRAHRVGIIRLSVSVRGRTKMAYTLYGLNDGQKIAQFKSMLVLRNNSLTGATKMKKLILISFLSLFSLYSFSEDIELYIGNSSQQSNAKPQVLLILDTSGSMGDYQTIKNVYNPNRTYAYQGGFSSRSSNYIYYGKGSVTDLPLVDDINENR